MKLDKLSNIVIELGEILTTYELKIGRIKSLLEQKNYNQALSEVKDIENYITFLKKKIVYLSLVNNEYYKLKEKGN